MWFEQRVQLVILLVLTLASAASWMSLSLFKKKKKKERKKKDDFCIFCSFLKKHRPSLWVMWWCSLVTFGRTWAPLWLDWWWSKVYNKFEQGVKCLSRLDIKQKKEKEREITEGIVIAFHGHPVWWGSLQGTCYGSTATFSFFLFF